MLFKTKWDFQRQFELQSNVFIAFITFIAYYGRNIVSKQK